MWSVVYQRTPEWEGVQQKKYTDKQLNLPKLPKSNDQNTSFCKQAKWLPTALPRSGGECCPQTPYFGTPLHVIIYFFIVELIWETSIKLHLNTTKYKFCQNI